MKLWEEKSGSVVVSVVFVQLYCTRKRELFVVFMQLKEEVVEENCVRSFCKPARGRAGCFREQMDCLELCSATTDVGSCVCIVFMQLSKEKWIAWSGVCRFNANQIRKKEKLYVKFLLNYGKKGYCGEQCP